MNFEVTIKRIPNKEETISSNMVKIIGGDLEDTVYRTLRSYELDVLDVIKILMIRHFNSPEFCSQIGWRSKEDRLEYLLKMIEAELNRISTITKDIKESDHVA